MNKTIGIILAIVVVLGGIYLISRTPNTENGSDTNVVTETPETTAMGRVVFSVTDAAVNMSTISEITMKVNSVDVHNTTDGWVTVSTTPRVYNLLALNAENKSELLAEVEIASGAYDQVRLVVDSVVVKTKAGATKEAKLPSGELRINANLLVKADATSSANFDFLADKSLHITGNGSYIFAPVVKTETKSDASVTIDAQGAVIVSGGNLDDSNTVGMDIDGNVKLNFQLNSNQKLKIDTDNKIKIEL